VVIFKILAEKGNTVSKLNKQWPLLVQNQKLRNMNHEIKNRDDRRISAKGTIMTE
jgi:hypothetical protein